MRDFSEKKSHKAPELEKEVTLFCTEPNAKRPRIRITAERFRILKSKQVLSYYRIYVNEELLEGTYKLGTLNGMLEKAREKVRFQKVEDDQVEKYCRSTRREKYSAAEII